MIDFLIIGGGIAGVSAAARLAPLGSVLLVEAAPSLGFLIIGGGIAGVSAAARLAPLGSVLLVEAAPSLGYHASGRSAAMYFENYGNEAVRVLNRASFEHLSTCAGGQGVLTPRGLLTLAGKGQEGAFAEVLGTPGTEKITFDQARVGPDPVARRLRAGCADLGWPGSGYRSADPGFSTHRPGR